MKYGKLEKLKKKSEEKQEKIIWRKQKESKNNRWFFFWEKSTCYILSRLLFFSLKSHGNQEKRKQAAPRKKKELGAFVITMEPGRNLGMASRGGCLVTHSFQLEMQRNPGRDKNTRENSHCWEGHAKQPATSAHSTTLVAFHLSLNCYLPLPLVLYFFIIKRMRCPSLARLWKPLSVHNYKNKKGNIFYHVTQIIC